MRASLQTRCCIAGGGPAGMLLGLLLARMGVDTFVLEKHADFLRDFRGDTIHPSTLQIMDELGLLAEFLTRPHQEILDLTAQVGNQSVTLADFRHIPTHTKFLALMPQWDFLDFLKQHASRYPSFRVMMNAEVVDLIIEKGIVTGAVVNTPAGTLELRAPLTIAADGRHSIVRQKAHLNVINLGAPMDVLWMKLSRRPDDPAQTFGHADKGKILILLNRDKYWQCAYVIPKGEADRVKQQGLSSLRVSIVELEPFLHDRVYELRDWKDVSVLTVTVDRLSEWSRPGLLCIGDAAHAMSPIGGVGINLAIQDAVATANLLGPTLLHGFPPLPNQLRAVQRRRLFPTRVTQALQLAIQNKAIRKVLRSNDHLQLPLFFKLLHRFPVLRRIPARLIGVGFLPEHVRTAAVLPPEPLRRAHAAGRL
jgi:2-polyprenyl-6-methoxyphenol hydroxylase-like FAD-dependent oxidoreductase